MKDHFATLIRNPASSNGKVNAFTSTPTTTTETESTSGMTTSFNQTEIDTETPLRLKKKRKRDNSETPSSSNSKHFNNSCNEEDNQASSSNINQQVPNKILKAGEFRAFDYSSIDFRKYQGGSQQRSTTDQVKTKFNGKVIHINYLSFYHLICSIISRLKINSMATVTIKVTLMAKTKMERTEIKAGSLNIYIILQKKCIYVRKFNKKKK